MSTAPTNLATRMGKAMASMTRLKKTGYNAHHKYEFATDTDVAEAVRKVLGEHQITMLHLGVIPETCRMDGKSFSAVFVYRFVNPDNPDDHFEVKAWGMANDAQDKGIAKAQTSAHKNMLLRTFNISTGDPLDDNDSHAVDAGPPARNGSAGTDWDNDKVFKSVFWKAGNEDKDRIADVARELFGVENPMEIKGAEQRAAFVAELKGGQ